MKQIRLSILLLAAFLTGNALAQQDTSFWFAVPRYLSEHTMDRMSDKGFYLVLVCHQGEANVTVSFPANPNIPDLHYKVKDKPIEVMLSAELKCINNMIAPPFNRESRRGIHISSDLPIQCYYQIPAANGANYMLKGQQALGKEFIVTMQCKHPNCTDGEFQSSYNAFELVATEDNTVVNIYPSNYYYHNKTSEYTASVLALSPMVNRQPNDRCYIGAVSVLLNKGETYAMRACGFAAGEQLTGTRIESNKPIAVTGNDDSVDQNGSGCDSQGDQLYPTSMAGKEFVITDCNDGENPANGFKWSTGNGYDIKWHGVYIYPLFDNTKVTYTIINKDGSLEKNTITLDKSSIWNEDSYTAEELEAVINWTAKTTRYNHTPARERTYYKQTAHFISTYQKAAMHIVSSQPVMVSQVNGYTAESGIAMIPPITTHLGMTEFTYSVMETAVLHLITKQAYADGFTVNGNPLNGTLHPLGDGTDYYYIAVIVGLADNVMHVKNTKGAFQAGVRDYHDAACSFSYFADYTRPSGSPLSPTPHPFEPWIPIIEDEENPIQEGQDSLVPPTVGLDSTLITYYPNVIYMGSTYYTCLGNDVNFTAKMPDGTPITSPKWTLPSGQERAGLSLAIHDVGTDDLGLYNFVGKIGEDYVESTFKLTVPDSIESYVTTRVYMCEGAKYRWPINNKLYTAPARDTLEVPALVNGQALRGCTKTLMLDLQATPKELDTVYIYYTLEQGDTLRWYGENITKSTIKERLVETPSGCSTFICLVVRVNDGSEDEGVFSEDDILNPDYPENPHNPDDPFNPNDPSNPDDPNNPDDPEPINPEDFDIYVYEDGNDAVLNIDLGKREADITVYSPIGIRVFSGHKSLTETKIVLPLPPTTGVYVVLITTSDNLKIKKKFVIKGE